MMKRKNILFFMIFCLVLLLPLTAKFRISVKAQYYDWIVDPNAQEVPGLFNTIQGAIDNSSSGQSIFVFNGTYYETLVINKSISLVGQGRDITTIDGSQSSNVITITAGNVTIKGFHVRNGSMLRNNSAIRIEHAQNNYITENIVSDSHDGIGIYSANNNTVSDNIVTNNFDGIGLYTSGGNMVSNNRISDNIPDGVGVYTSSANVISKNLVSGSIDGIALVSSSANFVTNNIITKNTRGIGLYTSSNNIVTGTSIDLSTERGITLDFGSSNNTFFHNNFNNSKQILVGGSSNIWDLNSEGNYWSDYGGTDSDANGIGDAPYIIDQHNRDSEPLMGTFSDNYILLHNESFEVDIISNSTVTNFEFEIGVETGNRIVRFNVGEQEELGFFCRAEIPNALMNYPSTVLVGEEEISPKMLNGLNSTYSSLYFSFAHSNRTVSIISSKALYLLNQLLEKYVQLEVTLGVQNNTYDILLKDYSNLTDRYDQLKKAYESLKSSYDDLVAAQSESINNNRSTLYIIAAAVAVFLAATVYLSKRAHEKPGEQP
jgi:parallel beta-helix repeat protein